MEVVKRSDDMKGFVALPHGWVVERTFSWFGRNRRLAKDFENRAETLATFFILASIQLALRRPVGRSRGLSKHSLLRARPAVGSVSGRWPERAAMTEMRRLRPLEPRRHK
jgi:hypothetical protein